MVARPPRLARKLLDKGEGPDSPMTGESCGAAGLEVLPGRLRLHVAAGSPCAISTIPQPRGNISPTSTRD